MGDGPDNMSFSYYRGLEWLEIRETGHRLTQICTDDNAELRALWADFLTAPVNEQPPISVGTLGIGIEIRHTQP